MRAPCRPADAMTQRPFFLNLLRIKLPIGGVVSILHRATGAVLSLLVPCLLYAFSLSLESAQGFVRVHGFLAGGFGWLLMSLVGWAMLHHFLAGLRHLGFDIGYGEDRATARATAWGTGVMAVLAAAGIAFWVLP
ncbi:MAG: succinate dehydrogenase, cytochrome b556 subunit [Hydrogenophilales bacterium CG17_big_fil_post_rev_8_21_14_2_50_63_12]|nr:MAG: succinate dehydrogenase, cytochrome b556 subunit [Hydrogenophilales bacterium CG17_big_fil_post_rev_8_21_14_2_50_63_12]